MGTDEIIVACQHCGAKFHVAAKHAGKNARCGKCRQPVRIPSIEVIGGPAENIAGEELLHGSVASGSAQTSNASSASDAQSLRSNASKKRSPATIISKSASLGDAQRSTGCSLLNDLHAYKPDGRCRDPLKFVLGLPIGWVALSIAGVITLSFWLAMRDHNFWMQWKLGRQILTAGGWVIFPVCLGLGIVGVTMCVSEWAGNRNYRLAVAYSMALTVVFLITCFLVPNKVDVTWHALVLIPITGIIASFYVGTNFYVNAPALYRCYCKECDSFTTSFRSKRFELPVEALKDLLVSGNDAEIANAQEPPDKKARSCITLRTCPCGQTSFVELQKRISRYDDDETLQRDESGLVSGDIAARWAVLFTTPEQPVPKK